MKEINVENFSYLNVKDRIKDYSHKEKVEIAINCAELVIDLYKGGSDAPRLAIEAAKVWVKSPTKENQAKCKEAAYAADAVITDVTTAAAAAAAAAAYAAAADDAATGKLVKEKIIGFIVSKIKIDSAALETKEPKRTKVEYVREKSLKEVLKCAIDGEVFYSKDGKGEFKFDVSRLSFVNHNGADMEIAYLTNYEFYRRIETPIEWWEDAKEFVTGGSLGHFSMIEDRMLIESAMTRDQWCDFARILLEQGE